MGYAFISYSSKNQQIADAMRILLNNKGIDTWMAPGDIPAGGKYAGVIKQALCNCSCLVLMLSQATQKSEWVPREVERAIHYNKTIIPIQIEEVVLSDEFEQYLSTSHIVYVNKINSDSSVMRNIISSISACVGYNFTDIKSSDFVPKMNESVFFGRYQQIIDDRNVFAPIEWMIKEITKTSILLLSKYCIEAMTYNKAASQSVTWSDCSLRKWLNQFFYETSFSNEEKELILNNQVINDANYESGADGGTDTTDKVFVFSAREADYYFKTDEERKAFGTQYANQQYMPDDIGNGLSWWLRSPGYYEYRTAIVNEYGKIDNDGYTSNKYSFAVRPAIRVKLL